MEALDVSGFLGAFFGDWVGWMSGLASVILTIIGFTKMGRVNQPRLFWGAALICFFIACVHIWTKEHAETVRLSSVMQVYLETSIDAMYPGPSPKDPPSLLVIGRPITNKTTWTRTGAGIALNVFSYADIAFGSDYTIETQKTLSAEFDKQWRERLATGDKQYLEGATLGYSKDSESVWLTTHNPRTLTKELMAQLWDGTTILYIFAAARYRGEGGGQYESHTCRWLQPFYVNDFPNHRKILPETDTITGVSWHNCGTYNSPIRVKQ